MPVARPGTAMSGIADSRMVGLLLGGGRTGAVSGRRRDFVLRYARRVSDVAS
jgi:hypothetical protein